MKINFILNGRDVTIDCNPEDSLLTVLKESLQINSVKRACLAGECGACTVIVDGMAMNSCMILAPTIDGKSIDTLESLGTPEHLHPIQRAFYELGASQCGFCTPGFIMSAKALLDNNPNPSYEEIRYALSGNLCRCTGYIKPLKAVKQAANEMAGIIPSKDSIDAVSHAAKMLQKQKGVL